MNKENSIEWYTGNNMVTISLSSKRHITKVKKLKNSHPNDIDIYENSDGTIYAHLPLSYIKISAPRQMTDEQKAAASKRLKELRNHAD